MENIMQMDSIQTMVKDTASSSGGVHEVWMYVALAEFVLLLFICVPLLWRRRSVSEKEEAKSRILKEGDIDFANVINSSFKSKSLYDELKRKCHPDKFAEDEALCATATEIFGLMVRHKHDYAALCKLKERARTELHINF